MRALLIAGLLASASAFAGDLVARNAETRSELRLLDAVCSHGGTLAILREEWRPKFKNARLTIRGELTYACWIAQGETAAIIFEDGTAAEVLLSAFSDPML